MGEIPEDIYQRAAHLAKEGRSYEDRRDRIARAILAERKRCIGHVYGLAGSDNVAQRTVEAIEAGA